MIALLMLRTLGKFRGNGSATILPRPVHREDDESEVLSISLEQEARQAVLQKDILHLRVGFQGVDDEAVDGEWFLRHAPSLRHRRPRCQQ